MDWTTPFVPLSQLCWNPAIRPIIHRLPLFYKVTQSFAHCKQGQEIL